MKSSGPKKNFKNLRESGEQGDRWNQQRKDNTARVKIRSIQTLGITNLTNSKI